MRSFADRFLTGEAAEDDVHEDIALWQEGDAPVPLYQYLGLSWAEYRYWADMNGTFAEILSLREAQP
jgi:hypothetical protein